MVKNRRHSGQVPWNGRVNRLNRRMDAIITAFEAVMPNHEGFPKRKIAIEWLAKLILIERARLARIFSAREIHELLESVHGIGFGERVAAMLGRLGFEEVTFLLGSERSHEFLHVLERSGGELDADSVKGFVDAMNTIFSLPLEDTREMHQARAGDRTGDRTGAGIVSDANAHDIDVLGLINEKYITPAMSRNERGIVYTPAPVVKYILQGTFQRRLSIQDLKNSERCHSTTILDPACGTGAFLVEAFKMAWQVMGEEKNALHGQIGKKTNVPSKKGILENPDIHHDPDAIQAASVILLGRIRGIDEDPVAVEIARVNLALEATRLVILAMENGNGKAGKNLEFEPAMLFRWFHECAWFSVSVGNAIMNIGITRDTKQNDPVLSHHVIPVREISASITNGTGLMSQEAWTAVRKERDRVEAARYKADVQFTSLLAGINVQERVFGLKPVHPLVTFGNMFLDTSGSLLPRDQRGFDVIVGNPPFVNYKKYLQIIDRTFLQHRYEIFTGQSDLSYYFFELHANWLKKGGTSSQVTSRYFMEGTHAKNLRTFLERYEITEIIDLNEINVFPGVGIHAAIFTFRNVPPEKDHVIQYIAPSRVETTKNGVLSIGKEGNGTAVPFCANAKNKTIMQVHLASMGTGSDEEGLRDGRGWCLLSPVERALKQRFDRCPELGTLGTCISGSETGLDEAFVKHLKRDGSNIIGEFQGKKFAIEPELVHPWIKNGEIQEFHHRASGYCLYVPPDLSEGEFKERYPNAYGFLSCFRTELEHRDGGHVTVPWYVWRRPRNVKNLNVAPKIILPYKAPSFRASIDQDKLYCSYDVTVFVPGDDALGDVPRAHNGAANGSKGPDGPNESTGPFLEYVVGYLNSAIANWFFNTIGKKMGNIREYYPGPVSRLRVPSLPVNVQEEIAGIVNKILEISENKPADKEIVHLKAKIDEIIQDYLGISEEERRIIMDGIDAS